MFKAEESIEEVEAVLKEIKELSHLKVRARGYLLILESVDTNGNTYPHARFRKTAPHKWYLEMPVKSGWESTFMEGSVKELTMLLIEKFPWALAFC